MITAIRSKLLVLGIILSLYACIGDDFVEDFVMPRIEVSNPIDSLKLGDSYQYKYRYFNNVGVVDSTIEVSWNSLTPSLLDITDQGLATSLLEGNAQVVLSSLSNPVAYDTIYVITNNFGTSGPDLPSERNGVIKSTSNYLLEGDVQIVNQDSQFILKLGENFMATSALPGLVVYLTNNPSTTNGALEVSPITQFTGAQEFLLPDVTDINEYDYVLFFCKPFAVKVGDGQFL
ncbi:MAG: hypothetical protein DRI71_11360 [Bacteroidetes bacterium]|nr:MAG: hypothetical protein DRI71_11360 [Bacteroidota bacterium]